jgi:gas vesicle protein
MRQFFLGLLIGIVIGAAGAMIYAEWESGPDEDAAAAEQAPADQR